MSRFYVDFSIKQITFLDTNVERHLPFRHIFYSNRILKWKTQTHTHNGMVLAIYKSNKVINIKSVVATAVQIKDLTNPKPEPAWKQNEKWTEIR